MSEIGDTLRKFPPQYPEPRERYLGLLLLDSVLHDVYAAHRAPVRKFFHSRMEATLEEIESTQVEEGAIIWKLYNMGVIVRTPTVTRNHGTLPTSRTVNRACRQSRDFPVCCTQGS